MRCSGFGHAPRESGYTGERFQVLAVFDREKRRAYRFQLYPFPGNLLAVLKTLLFNAPRFGIESKDIRVCFKIIRTCLGDCLADADRRATVSVAAYKVYRELVANSAPIERLDELHRRVVGG